jgi:hypothetical protein
METLLECEVAMDSDLAKRVPICETGAVQRFGGNRVARGQHVLPSMLPF